MVPSLASLAVKAPPPATPDPRARCAPPRGRLCRGIPCREEDPELWFAESPKGLELAKVHCRRCPLMEPCLAGAVARGEPWGVWGGEIFDQGRIVAVKRTRGRPRKRPSDADASTARL